MVRTPRWLVEVCGRAGSLCSAEDGVLVVVVVADADVVVADLRLWRDEVEAAAAAAAVVFVLPALLLSMMAVAKEADFLRASLFGSGVVLVVDSGFAVEEGCAFPVDADADADADAEDVELSHALRAARPRTSPTRSAADFFLDLSSSDDRLEDMMVSSVP